jgi:DNA-binding transcriptional MerR regulator
VRGAARTSHREYSLALVEPDAHAIYSLEMVARLARVSRYRVGLYCKHGLVRPLRDPAAGGWVFDAGAIRTVRQLESIRERFGVNLAGAEVLTRLLREVDELRRELRFLRGA